ncbi:hypothetical protein J2T60_000524 [Natronospira proteinivora]|uniref:Uncharacterized protein n=1 Tax=Natronospira proteinivora TaxID=1807133 RepID=A0ABT1G5I0_9GAMM|nr:hypothetical protein [Natronospira proteinivora]MCP1726559.1 hypothetical protein [Natronospira proteinivora]
MAIWSALILAAGTIIAAVWLRPVLWYRTLHEAINDQLESRRRHNAKLQAYVKDIMRSLDQTSNNTVLNRPSSPNDYSDSLKLVEGALDRAIGCNEAVATYCVLFERTLSPLRRAPGSNSQPNLVFVNLHYYLSRGAATIENAASNYIELPDKLKVGQFNPIRKNLRGFVGKSRLKHVPGLSRGLDISPLSPYVLDFYADVISRTFRDNPEFFRSFFQVIGDNALMGVILYQQGFYYPLTIKLPPIPLFGQYDGLLIGFKLQTHFSEEGGRPEVVLYYSHLSSSANFMAGYAKNGSVQQSFVDTNLCPQFDFKSHIRTVEYVTDEVVAVYISQKSGEDAFELCRPSLQDWLIRKAGRWWPKEKAQIWLTDRIRRRPALSRILGISE